MAHRLMQNAMTELSNKKSHSEAELILGAVDKMMLNLIKDVGLYVARSDEPN